MDLPRKFHAEFIHMRRNKIHFPVDLGRKPAVILLLILLLIFSSHCILYCRVLSKCRTFKNRYLTIFARFSSNSKEKRINPKCVISIKTDRISVLFLLFFFSQSLLPPLWIFFVLFIFRSAWCSVCEKKKFNGRIFELLFI